MTATASLSEPPPSRRRLAVKPTVADALRAPWTRTQMLVAAILMLGSASVLLEGILFRRLQRSDPFMFFSSDHLVRSADAHATAVDTVVEAQTAVVLPADTQTQLQTPVPAPASPPTPSPVPTFSSTESRTCFYERDVGIINEIRESRRAFCEEPSDNSTRRTRVEFYDLQARSNIQMRAMVFDRDFSLDLTDAEIHRPIHSFAQDGGDHDPRFDWTPRMISCGCHEFQDFATEFYRATGNRTTLRPWDPTLAGTYERIEDPSTVCGVRKEPTLTFPPSTPAARAPPLVITDKTVLITRRDDHNPFFQVSGALNAWLMMRTLGWHRNETRYMQFDGGYPSPVDDLQYRLVSEPSKFKLLRGSEHLMGHKLQFTNQVMIAPYETTGPLMQHLNDDEVCNRSTLIQDFRADALKVMDVEAQDSSTKPITVTIISRRNYGGRTVQRRWLNEDEVLDAMRQAYPRVNDTPIVIQSLEFVDLTLKEQMEISLNSDVIIGMHGAGMVNVLWTKPETLVVEIFPRYRYRWGYRNICRYIGCDWHEFRGGKDTGRGDNASDKRILVDEWLAFFDPLFRKTVGLPPKPTAAPTAPVLRWRGESHAFGQSLEPKPTEPAI